MGAQGAQNFINIINTQIATIGGSAGGGSIDHVIGKYGFTTANSATDYYQFAAPAGSAEPSATIGVILSFFGTSATQLYLAAGNTAGTELGLRILNNNFGFSTAGSMVDCTNLGLSLGSLAVGTSLFVAVSNSGSNGYNIVCRNLDTGQIYTGTGTTGTNVQSATSTIEFGNYHALGSFGSGQRLAAFMFSYNYTPLASLLEWAKEPWAFWYPQTGPQPEMMNSRLPSVGPATYAFSVVMDAGQGQREMIGY